MKPVLYPAFLILFLIAACAPTTRSPDVSNEEALQEIRIQKKLAADEEMGQLKRLYRIGMPIMAANAPLCGKKIWPHTGMMVESLSSVPEDFKDAMQIYYDLKNQLTVAYIVPGSPAEGRLFPGDAILKVNGESIPSGSKGKKEFYESIWKEGRDVTLPITFTVERGRQSKPREVVIHPTAGCASFLVLKKDDEVNAYADSVNITFNTGMMRFAADDRELASILAHELSHNARLHNESSSINTLLAYLTSVIIESATGLDMSEMLTDLGSEAFSQAYETEADYVGLYMLARAGYDLQKAIEVERRFAATYPDSIHLAGTSHPSSAKRFLSMKKTIAEIEAKRAKGLPLIPEEKTGADILNDLEKIN